MNPLTFLFNSMFGPRLGRVRDWNLRVDLEGFDEQGSIGIPQRKQYRDAIERHWTKTKSRRVDRTQWTRQLIHAEKEMAEIERELTMQGYVNTIHDCWEKP